MVVDFSESPPIGYGVYPGGQSGNPFSPNYDAHIQKYLGFEYYSLLNTANLNDIQPDLVHSKLVFSPAHAR